LQEKGVATDVTRAYGGTEKGVKVTGHYFKERGRISDVYPVTCSSQQAI
jgi:hypothetical protein